MEDPLLDGLTQHDLFEQLCELVDQVGDKPRPGVFSKIGKLTVQWMALGGGSPRGVTSLSGSETLVDKEDVPEPKVWYHQTSDHAGEPHGSAACLALDDYNPQTYTSDYDDGE